MEFFNFYDIKLDENGQVYLELITKRLVSEFNNGVTVSYYIEVSREREYPEDIKKRIKYLQAIGYNSILVYENNGFCIN